MLEQLIKQISNLAHSIDPRINLFEGYVPKRADSYKGELRFWREVVSIYAIFADCDRVQIKEKNNLFDLMSRYTLIERGDYDEIKRFWDDISNLRKWLCHNNDTNRFFIGEKEKKITSYLDRAFMVNSNKPVTIDDVQSKDWNLLCFNIESRFERYLKILKGGLEAWGKSEDKTELCDQWLIIFSNALFNDNELIMNVLADIASYNILNNNIKDTRPPSLSRSYRDKIISGGFSDVNIKEELNKNSMSVRSNKEIVHQSIVNSHLI